MARSRNPEEPPFFLRSKGELPKLTAWLRGHDFNCGGYIRDDKRGNPMVSIGWDSRPDSDWHLPDKRGLIVVCDRSLLDEVKEMVQRMARKAPGHAAEAETV